MQLKYQNWRKSYQNNITTLRPKIGLCSSKYFQIINKFSKRDYKKDSPIKSDEIN